MATRMVRTLSVFLLSVFALTLSGSDRTAAGRAAGAGAEIRWDTYGIPHIRASTTEDLFYAFAWAQMVSHGNLLLEQYARARGRAAEYFGPSYLDSDRWVLTNGIPERAEAWTLAQPAAFRRLLDAFARGINDYGVERADTLAPARRAVLPVSTADILAHVQHAIHFTFVISRDRLPREAPAPTAGSNGWVVAPSRSATGHAMLLVNPHLPWSGLYRMLEAQLTVDGVVNAYGVTFVGFPVLGIAFNEALGWTHTVNAMDGADLFNIAVEGEQYLWNGELRPFDTTVHTIRVRQENGSLATEELRVRRSIHGPVVVRNANTGLALRVAGLAHSGLLEQWWDMARATSLESFERAVRRLQIPIFTILYADARGHIMHLFGGLSPKREQANLPWRAAVPGDTPSTLWNSYHTYADLPRVLDPRSGWLQNANEPPWWTTVPAPLKAGDYPPYLAAGSLTLRAQRSIALLEGPRLSLDELIRRKHSTVVELAERVLDDMVAWARASSTPDRARAVRALEAWDRRVDPASRGAVLFVAWATELTRRTGGHFPYAEPWREDAPLALPRGIARSSPGLDVLDAVIARLDAAGTPLDTPWGERYRIRLQTQDVAANGGPGELGVFRTLSFAPAKDGRHDAFFGDSFVAAVEFSRPLRARALLVYGNWTQGGAHQADQLALFARGELRPVWFTRDEVARHTGRTDVVPRRRKPGGPS